MSKCFLVILEKRQAEIQLVVIAKSVLITVLYCSDAVLPKAALNEGQYTNKKRVPTIAMTLE